LRILYFISTDYNIAKPRHGAERALRGLADSLVDRGHEYGVVNGRLTQPDWDKDWDIVHHFNSSGGNGPHQMAMTIADQLDIPSVATPVYWPPDKLMSEIKDHGSVNEDRLEDTLNYQAEWLVKADLLLTNSEAEADKVEEFLYPDCPDQKIMYNAVDTKESLQIESMAQKSRAELQLEDAGNYVLCVGKVEPRKNQERLVHAMSEIPDATLLMAGEVNDSYADSFRPYIDDSMQILPRKLSPVEVRALISHASIVAQPSVFETPGLVLLEAASVGKPIVATENGATQEYFGDYAHYCDPFRVDDIGNALSEAWEDEQSDELKEMVRSKYTYQTTAKKVEKIYQSLIGE